MSERTTDKKDNSALGCVILFKRAFLHITDVFYDIGFNIYDLASKKKGSVYSSLQLYILPNPHI